MKEIYRWVSEDGGVHEYRFTDGICDGFFTNGVEKALEQKYKGRPITDEWLSNLPSAGFVKVEEPVM